MNLISMLIFTLLFEHGRSTVCQKLFMDRALKKAPVYPQNKTHKNFGPKRCRLIIPTDQNLDKYDVFGEKISSGACIDRQYSKGRYPGIWKSISKENVNETATKNGKDCSYLYMKREKKCVDRLHHANVYTIFENYTIRELDERENTVTMDLSLKLRWTDQRIFTQEDSSVHLEEKEKGYEISLEAAKTIWKPELPVHNIADYKRFKDSVNMISLRIKRENYLYKNDCIQGPILIYEIEVKPTFYCHFDLWNYPMDKSSCKFRLGGKVSNMAFKLIRRSNDPKGTKSFEISDLIASGSIVEDCKNTETETSLGLDIKIERDLKQYMLKYYIPCIMTVLISHLSFIIPLDALQGRVALVVTQFLTLTNLFIHQLVSFKMQINFYLTSIQSLVLRI